MQYVVIFSQVLSIIVLCVIAFIIYHSVRTARMSKRNIKELLQDKAFMQLMREADLEQSKHEPDELIETWQDGYVTALKTFAQKTFDSYTGVQSYNRMAIEMIIAIINQLQVITEMNLQFIFVEGFIYVQDKDSKKRWQPQQ